MVSQQQKKLAGFEVKGTRKEKEESRPFTKHINAFSQSNARERTMALFGSKNKTKRRNITISGVKPAKGA